MIFPVRFKGRLSKIFTNMKEGTRGRGGYEKYPIMTATI